MSKFQWSYIVYRGHRRFNALRPRQNGRHFADDIFKWIFLNENVWIPIKISLKFVPQGPINNIPTLVQIMVWRRPGDKPLSGPMMVTLPTHICVTRPQWVNEIIGSKCILAEILKKFKTITKIGQLMVVGQKSFWYIQLVKHKILTASSDGSSLE